MDNKQKQKKYLSFFRVSEGVLELGSGSGDFMQLCAENGFDVTGVDVVEPAEKNGVKFINSSIEVFLKAPGGRKFGGIYMRHVAEHFWPEELESIFEMCRAILFDGGRVVVITPNMGNIAVATKSFWGDETHKRPYTELSLSKIALKTGFRVVEYGFDQDSYGRGLIRSAGRFFRKLLTGIPQEPPDIYVVMEKRDIRDD